MNDDTKDVLPTSESHDRRGKFAPGNNVRQDYRVKRQRGVARMIAQETRNGKEMVAVALEVMRDAAHRDRLKAADWLMTRFAGKVRDVIEVTGADGQPINPLANFTPEQLLALVKGEGKGNG